MLNNNAYGSVDETPKPVEGGPVHAVCNKCKAKFLLEKHHKEIHVNAMFYRRKADKTLVPTRPTDKNFHRLCDSCYKKFQDWLDQ